MRFKTHLRPRAVSALLAASYLLLIASIKPAEAQTLTPMSELTSYAEHHAARITAAQIRERGSPTSCSTAADKFKKASSVLVTLLPVVPVRGIGILGGFIGALINLDDNSRCEQRKLTLQEILTRVNDEIEEAAIEVANTRLLAITSIVGQIRAQLVLLQQQEDAQDDAALAATLDNIVGTLIPDLITFIEILETDLSAATNNVEGRIKPPPMDVFLELTNIKIAMTMLRYSLARDVSRPTIKLDVVGDAANTLDIVVSPFEEQLAGLIGRDRFTATPGRAHSVGNQRKLDYVFELKSGEDLSTGTLECTTRDLHPAMAHLESCHLNALRALLTTKTLPGLIDEYIAETKGNFEATLFLMKTKLLPILDWGSSNDDFPQRFVPSPSRLGILEVGVPVVVGDSLRYGAPNEALLQTSVLPFFLSEGKRFLKDANRDGRIDLIVIYGGYAFFLPGGSMEVPGESTPRGIFDLQALRYTPNLPGHDWPVAKLVDVNDDGFLDFVAMRGEDVSVVPGMEGGQFDVGAHQLMRRPYFDWPFTELADVNNDGFLDFVAIQGDDAYVVPGTASGRFDHGARQFMRQIYFDWPFTKLADVNNDGFLDFVAIQGDDAYVVPGTASGRFDHNARQFMRQIYFDWPFVEIADVNSDGFLDFVAVQGDGAYVVPGTASGRFAHERRQFMRAGYFEWSKALADVDNDGFLDFIAMKGEAGYVVPGTASGRFDHAARQYVAARAFGSYRSSAISALSNSLFPAKIVDVNGDGFRDFFNFGMFVPGTAGGRFDVTRIEGRFLDHYPGFRDMVLGEVNGDGVLDVIVLPPPNAAVAKGLRLVEEGALLLDVRTAQEYASGHVPGAVNIPVEDLEARAAELPERSVPVVVYCDDVRCSALAKRILDGLGRGRVLDGGKVDHWPRYPSSMRIEQ